jgi:hypothetical protein
MQFATRNSHRVDVAALSVVMGGHRPGAPRLRHGLTNIDGCATDRPRAESCYHAANTGGASQRRQS